MSTEAGIVKEKLLKVSDTNENSNTQLEIINQEEKCQLKSVLQWISN